VWEKLAANVSKKTGKLYWHSDSSDELDELPDDVDDDDICTAS
jgi:hypothetical protein